MSNTDYYKILLVHNNEELVHSVNAQFRKDIDEIYVCDDSSRAFKKALSVKPHLIIIDVDSQPLSSFELAAQIRQTKELMEVPIIFTYSKRNSNTPILAFTLGATAFLNTDKDLSLLVQESKLFMDLYQFKRLAKKVYQNDQ